MRIRTLRSELKKGRRFTAWLGGVRVTLSSLESFDACGSYENQRQIAETAVEISKPHPALKKELKWHWQPADDTQEHAN